MRVGPPRSVERFEPFERQRQVRAALVVGHGVDFVDDDRFDVAQNLRGSSGREQDVERLGRRDQDVRRRFSIAGAPHAACRRCGRRCESAASEAALARQLQDFAERAFEVLLDVVAERFERRDVEHFRAIGRARRRAPCGPAGRCRPGMRPAFCRSRWARR